MSCAGGDVDASPGGDTPAARVLRRLLEVAASRNYYWAWTSPWRDALNPNGDASFAIRRKDGGFDPKPLQSVVLRCGYQRYSDGRRPLINYFELNAVAGTWHAPDYYAVNRATLNAAVRRQWQEFGALAVFSWHMDSPFKPGGEKGDSFRYMPTNDAVRVRTVKCILDGEGGPCGNGSIDGRRWYAPSVNAHVWFLERLKSVADFINTLVDETGRPIPVMLRYPHECDGEWFWWGKHMCTRDEYRRFCRLIADYLRKACGADRLLFAYTPDRFWKDGFGCEGDNNNTYLAYYPGDRYVDIVAIDDYSIGNGTDEEAEAALEKSIRRAVLISEFAAVHGKVAALSETGGFKKRDDFWKYLYRFMTAPGVRFAFVDTWSGCYGTLPDTSASAEDEIAFARRSETLMEDSGMGFRD